MGRKVKILKSFYFYVSIIYKDLITDFLKCEGYKVFISNNGKMIVFLNQREHIFLKNTIENEWKISHFFKAIRFDTIVSFSLNDEYLLTGDWKGVIVLYVVNTRTKIKTYKFGLHGIIGFIWVTPSMFIPVDENETMKIYHILYDKEIKTITTTKNHDCRCIIYNNNSNHIITGVDNDINIFELTNIDCFKTIDVTLIKTLHHSDSYIYCLAYSSNKNILASGSDDNNIALWNAATPEYKLLAILKGHSTTINSISFSPNGLFLISISIGNPLKLWNCSTYKCVDEYDYGTRDSVLIQYSPVEDLILMTGCNLGLAVVKIINKDQVIQEQADLSLSLFKSKIRTPPVIIDYFDEFIMGTEYNPITY